MLIPSIDLMGGKVVQLVHGSQKVFESEDLEYWIGRFSTSPRVQLIDLDAAFGRGHNRDLVKTIVSRLPCQVGGGIRTCAAARELLEMGARSVIVGSALVHNNEPNIIFASCLLAAVGRERLIFAVDSIKGKVSIAGWRQITHLDPLSMIRSLERYCDAFLYTHIDSEGLMQGFPFHVAQELRRATKNGIIVAGGITSLAEVTKLQAINVDAVVGMAIYKGLIEISANSH